MNEDNELKGMIEALSRAMNEMHAELMMLRQIVAKDSDIISERKAYRMFGEGNVDRWVRQGKVQVHRSGSAQNAKKRISLTQLQAVQRWEDNASLKFKPLKS